MKASCIFVCLTVNLGDVMTISLNQTSSMHLFTSTSMVIINVRLHPHEGKAYRVVIYSSILCGTVPEKGTKLIQAQVENPIETNRDH